MDDSTIDLMFGIPSTVIGSKEWKELENRENSIGPEQLLNEIIEKKLWSNTEIIWVLKRMIFFYGKKDNLLKKAPIDRIFMNLVDILRSFFILFDISDPKIDENMRSYICSKLSDATWGISSRTRNYLYKIEQ